MPGTVPGAGAKRWIGHSPALGGLRVQDRDTEYKSLMTTGTTGREGAESV